MGADTESHITHTISEPAKVAFEDGSLEHGGILDIEDQAGSKTLIMFIQPCPVIVKYERAEIIAASS